jgi:imidazolonepropionase-like amidohydrolase
MRSLRFALAASSAALTVPLLLANGGDPLPVASDNGALVAYRAARIYRSGGDSLADACLLIADGKVVGIVPVAEVPALTPMVDLGNTVLFPGLVAADAALTGGDGQGDLSLGAHRHAMDAYDPWQDHSKILERGITTAYLSPDRTRLIGGRGAVVKMGGESRVLKSTSDLRVNLTPDAWFPEDYFRPPIPPTSENPLLPAIAQAPTSRPGALLALREARAAVRETKAGSDPNVEGLRAYFASKEPLRIVVRSTDEALAALALGAEWDRRVILDGLEQVDAVRLLAEAEAQDAQLIFALPLFASTPDLDASWSAPKPDQLRDLARFGPIALRPGVFGRWTWMWEAAALAVGYGLTEQQALDGLTSVPAQILGLEDRVGSLQDGCDADFIALSGEPLDPATRVLEVFISGQRVWSAAELAAAERIARPSRSALSGPPVVVRAGTLWTGDGAALTGGAEVLLQDGRVVAAGRSVPHPPGVRVIDAGADAHITPGYVDARSLLGAGSVSDARVDLGRLAAGSMFSDAWLPVARAGVTTLVIGPSGLPASGARASFVKTAAASSSDAALENRHVVFFDLRSRDRALGAEALKGQLQRGKGYADKWAKYREERAKWEGEQGSKLTTDRSTAERELRARLAKPSSAPVADGAKKDEKDADAKPAEGAAEETAKNVDPINGLWEATITHQMLPEPVEVHLRLHHEGAKLTGIFSSPMDPSGESMEIEGTYDEAAKTIRFEMPTEIGNAVLTGKVTAPDTMEMRAELAGLGSVDFTAARTEVEESGPAVTRKRTKTDDGPQAPPVDWNLEGIRALFEKRAVAVVYADRRDEIQFALQTLKAFELPVLIGGAAEGLDVLPDLREAHAGVVLGPDLRRNSDNRDEVPAALLLSNGVPVAFQSASGVGARFLPDVVKMSVRFGLGADAALHALTGGAADLLGVADRVGRLKAGLDGDLVVHSGAPLDLRSRVLHVFVNGREVPQE